MAFQMKRIYARLILLIMVAIVFAVFIVMPALYGFVDYVQTHLIGNELFTAVAGVPYQLQYQNIGSVTVQSVSTSTMTNSTILYL